MFMSTYALHTVFYACFLIQTYWYTWFTVVPLIFFILHIIVCTCMPEPHHLIMYTCVCYARYLALLYVLAGLHLTTLNSHVQILEMGPWWPCCNWSEYAAGSSVRLEHSRSLDYHRSSSSQFLSCLVLEAPLAAREHLSAFVYLFTWGTFVFLVI